MIQFCNCLRLYLGIESVCSRLLQFGCIVCYTAVFRVVTQRSSPQTAAENRTTFLSLCVCGYVSRRAPGCERTSQVLTNQSIVAE